MYSYQSLFICCNATFFIFFFNATATTEIYTLSLHDALPICLEEYYASYVAGIFRTTRFGTGEAHGRAEMMERSEEHTSELQSRENLVCRLLLEKKKENCRYVSQSISSKMHEFRRRNNCTPLG